MMKLAWTPLANPRQGNHPRSEPELPAIVALAALPSESPL